nr:uncharacterized protein LOC110362496 isoform X3 [Columba livia]
MPVQHKLEVGNIRSFCLDSPALTLVLLTKLSFGGSSRHVLFLQLWVTEKNTWRATLSSLRASAASTLLLTAYGVGLSSQHHLATFSSITRNRRTWRFCNLSQAAQELCGRRGDLPRATRGQNPPQKTTAFKTPSGTTRKHHNKRLERQEGARQLQKASLRIKRAASQGNRVWSCLLATLPCTLDRQLFPKGSELHSISAPGISCHYLCIPLR